MAARSTQRYLTGLFPDQKLRRVDYWQVSRPRRWRCQSLRRQRSSQEAELPPLEENRHFGPVQGSEGKYRHLHFHRKQLDLNFHSITVR